MILTIFFVILLLFATVTVLLRWKGSVIWIPLMICLAGLVFVIYLNTSARKSDERYKKTQAMNLIEMTGYSGSLSLTRAKTTAGVNMRNQAGRDGSVIQTVPEGTEIILLQTQQEDGWFEVEYAGQSGWIYGKYLQGITGPANRVAQAQVSRTGALRYILPEKTWWGKLLGLFIGVSLCFMLALMGYVDMLSVNRFGISWAYFFMKSVYFLFGSDGFGFGLGDLSTLFVVATLLTFLANAFANVSLNLIDQHRFRAVSQ